MDKNISSKLSKENITNTTRMNRKDYFFVFIITLLYAFLAYYRLGSFTSPQTSYTFCPPINNFENITFDLNTFQSNFNILYMGGIQENDHAFILQTSTDGTTWNDPVHCNVDIGDLFKWKYATDGQSSVPHTFSGRYVRLSANQSGLTLLETLFRDQSGNPLPVSATSSIKHDVSALIDEPFSLKGEPSWYNSMYFDEIYFARTGYEYLHDLSPYETSHPPLGKLIMSWCIAIFGMTPLGWRFAGASCGILMLPGIYLLAKLLFKKTRYAALAILLLSLDTMHYTQTRMATIDSFSVLFIIWSFYFMLDWFYMDFFKKRLWKTLLPLAISGFFMGLAVASKWTGCFAGVGLAVIYFWGLGRRIHSFTKLRKNQKCAESENSFIRHGARKLLLSVISCLFFFILIPAIIYYCSYIPHFASLGEITIQNVINITKYMYSYHSFNGLGISHPYHSPWYEWLLSSRPICYAMNQYAPSGFTYAIFAMGNYAIWWGGGVALIITIFFTFLQIINAFTKRQHCLQLTSTIMHDERHLLLIICFAAQFLPWVFISRSTFIYHYFPSIPFIILCTCHVLNISEHAHKAKQSPSLSNYASNKLFFTITIAYAVIALIVFILFFPIASGFTVNPKWLKFINWFNNIYYLVSP